MFPGPDQDETGAGEHSKGRKIPKWQTNATTKAKVRCSQLHLTDRIYRPDLCKAGFKCRIGATALVEIRHYQKNFKFLMAVHPFIRLVWEILDDVRITGRNDLRIQSTALVILQMAAETYLVSHFEDSGLCAIHTKRVSVMPKDTHLALRIHHDKVVRRDIESSSQLSGAKQDKKRRIDSVVFYVARFELCKQCQSHIIKQKF